MEISKTCPALRKSSLSKEEEERRLKAYKSGLSDKAMAQMFGLSLRGITSWRHSRGLLRAKRRGRGSGGRPKGRLNGQSGVPMHTALTLSQCEIVEEFLRCLAHYSKRVYAIDPKAKINVGVFMAAYRKIRIKG